MLKVGFEVKASTTHQHPPQRKGRLFNWVLNGCFFKYRLWGFEPLSYTIALQQIDTAVSSPRIFQNL